MDANTGGGASLRPARSDDVSAIARVWHAGWSDGHLGHVPEQLLAHRTRDHFDALAQSRVADTTVAVVGAEVVGFVVVHGDELEQCYVDAASRGSGVAALLIAHAERTIGAGHARAWLAVVGGNARARRFYERSGWHDAGGFDYQAEVEGGVVAVPARRYEKELRQPGA